MKMRFLLVIASLLSSTPTNAAYFIQASQVDGNVVFTGSGSLNLAALTPWSTIAPNVSFVAPTSAIAVIGTPEPTQLFSGTTGPSTFGTGVFVFASPTSATGSQVGVAGTNVRTPLGYVSGSSLGTSTSVYENSTFATLELATGNYVWSWGQGATFDTLTLQIGDVAGAVPEPATWGMMLIGFAAIGARMRNRRRHNVRVNYA